MESEVPSNGLQEAMQAQPQQDLHEQANHLHNQADRMHDEETKLPMRASPGYEQHLHSGGGHLEQAPEQLAGTQLMDPQMNASLDGMGLQQVAHAHLMGVPPGLAALQPSPGPAMQDDEQEGAKFKPIDLERLTPKSRQRVLRNRQAATRSKAKKKQQFQVLKDKKLALETELEQLEAQHAAAEQRVGQLHAENKALLESCKCP